jgi:Uma2 family endonuclease
MATTQIRIGPADHGRRMTLDEFRDAEEEPGYVYELARGVLEVIEIPKTPHRRIASNLFSLAAAYKRDHPGIIDYFGGGMEVRIWKVGMDMARHPDLGVVLLGAPTDTVGDPMPALVAEVVSRSSKARDYEAKRQEYLIYGVREYWIVDPFLRRVTVLLRQGDGAEATWAEQTFEGDAVIVGEVLPGLAARVADLWAGVDPEDL